MALFLNLYVGHLLGDFMLQPGRLVLAKREGIAGLILHTVIVGVASAAVVCATIRADWPAVTLVAGLHLVIEGITILGYNRTRTRGLFILLLDQTMHALSIGLAVWVAGGLHVDTQAVTFGVRLPITTLGALTGLLVVMLFGSILTFESANALVSTGDGKGRVLSWDLPRIGGVVERGAALALALLLHPAAAVVPFVPRFIPSLPAHSTDRTRNLVEAGVGLALCLAVYAAVRLLAWLIVPGSTTAMSALVCGTLPDLRHAA